MLPEVGIDTWNAAPLNVARGGHLYLKCSSAKMLPEVGIDPALLNVARGGQLILLNAALPNIARGGH